MCIRDRTESMLTAAKQWEAGDNIARSETGWATGEVTSTVRQHLERLKSLVLPLIEQTIKMCIRDSNSIVLKKVSIHIHLLWDILNH